MTQLLVLSLISIVFGVICYQAVKARDPRGDPGAIVTAAISLFVSGTSGIGAVITLAELLR